MTAPDLLRAVVWRTDPTWATWDCAYVGDPSKAMQAAARLKSRHPEREVLILGGPAGPEVVT